MGRPKAPKRLLRILLPKKPRAQKRLPRRSRPQRRLPNLLPRKLHQPRRPHLPKRLLFPNSPDVVVSRESAHTSTKRPELSSALSSRTLSVTPSPTPNTPSARPSPLSTLSTLSSVKAAPFTASADDRYHLFRIDHFCVN